jgi:hypothetical protein
MPGLGRLVVGKNEFIGLFELQFNFALRTAR